MNRTFLSLVCGLALVSGAFAQTAVEDLQISKDGPDTYTVSWFAVSGRTYFLQYSEDMITWAYFPDYTVGLVLGEGVRFYGGISVSGPEKFFLRLKYPVEPLVNPFYGDIDGDKVPNVFELEGLTDPFSSADADMDEMPDDWEIRFGLNPNDPGDATGLNADPDEDGIFNREEFLNGAAGTDPTDYYNGNFPVVDPISPFLAWDEPGTLVAEPFVFELTYPGLPGNPRIPVDDGPVTISVDSPNSGQISLNSDGSDPATSLDLRTDSNGRVQVYFKHSSTNPPVPTTRTIFATVGSKVPTGDINQGHGLAVVQHAYDYPPNTVGLSAAEAIDSRLTGKDAANALRVFSTQDYNAQPPIYVRNTAAWCYDLRQQMTCISPWHSRQNIYYGVTAITPQHVITSAHVDPQFQVDDTVRFVTADNVVVVRTIIGRARHPGYGTVLYADLTILTLDSPLPPTITPCKVLPDNYENYLSYLENGRPPVLVLDQEEKALVWELRALGASADYVQPVLHQKRREFFEPIIPGDSGNPQFLIVKDPQTLVDTLVLLSTASGVNQNPVGAYIMGGTFATPNISTLNAMIAAADADTANYPPFIQITTGMTVQTIDLSGFNTFTPP